MVTITDKAAAKMKEVLASESKEYLRIGVSGGGCSGLQYVLQAEENKMDNDNLFEVTGVKLLVDPISIKYLDGAIIDLTENLAGPGFTIQNPGAKSTCGCGQSFEPK